jgi:hypothetical protein
MRQYRTIHVHELHESWIYSRCADELTDADLPEDAEYLGRWIHEDGELVDELERGAGLLEALAYVIARHGGESDLKLELS